MHTEALNMLSGLARPIMFSSTEALHCGIDPSTADARRIIPRSRQRAGTLPTTLYRVNAGALELVTADSGPNWEQDTETSPGMYLV
ncbi:MAG: hypothetical protein ACR2NM_05020, partial [Bythopirellula sp.]